MNKEEIKTGFDYLNYIINERETKEYKLWDIEAELKDLERKIFINEQETIQTSAELDIVTAGLGIRFSNLANVLVLQNKIETLENELFDLEEERIKLEHEQEKIKAVIQELDKSIARVTSALEDRINNTGYVFGIESKQDEDRIYKGL